MDSANFIVGVTALAVSLGGFAIAIWQIRKAKSAAEAANRAATQARESLVHRLSIGDLARASSEIDRLKDLHRAGEWQRALDQYPRVRQTLVDVRTRVEEDAPETATAFQGAVAQLAQMESAVERALPGPEPTLTAATLNRRLVSIQGTLDDLRSKLEGATTGPTE